MVIYKRQHIGIDSEGQYYKKWLTWHDAHRRYGPIVQATIILIKYMVYITMARIRIPGIHCTFGLAK